MVGWAGSLIRFIGCLLFLVAFWLSPRKVVDANQPGEDMRWSFWPDLEQQYRQRNAELMRINERLQMEVGERQRTEEQLRWSEASLSQIGDG